MFIRFWHANLENINLEWSVVGYPLLYPHSLRIIVMIPFVFFGRSGYVYDCSASKRELFSCMSKPPWPTQPQRLLKTKPRGHHLEYSQWKSLHSNFKRKVSAIGPSPRIVEEDMVASLCTPVQIIGNGAMEEI